MKRLTALVLIAALLLQLHPVAFADDSDIFGHNVQPNVLIVLDNSTSMNDPKPSLEYDPAVTYPVVKKCNGSNCTSTVVYKSDTSTPPKYTQYATNSNSVSNCSDGANCPSARNALSTAGYWTGSIGGSTVHLFLGNYLNLANCTSTTCSDKKIRIAKRVVNRLFDNVQGVRFGIMKFWSNGSDNMGAELATDPLTGARTEIGTDVAALKRAVGTDETNGITLTSGTPLGEALYDAGQYYKGQPVHGTTRPNPIQLACQPNFIIFVTDGMQTRGTRLIPDEATLRYTQDHAPAITGVQNVIVDTVAFGVADAEQSAANTDLANAAKNGGGQFYLTGSEDELEQALQAAIRRIIAATFTFATPVLPTTSTTGLSRAYLAAFRSDPTRSFWQGYLKAYQRDSAGMVPVDANGVPLESAKIWDSGTVLSTMPSASRTIYTTINGNQQEFTTANTAIKAKVLGVQGKASANQVIDFIRGVDVFDENGNGNVTEDRSWKLGDIFHSTPVLVTPPLLALNDSSYQSFKQANASRTKVLIAGANDGMLHAFRESDGAELWAFIPEDQLDDLNNATVTFGVHPYFVDGSPIAADIKIGGAWRTIVVFGLRRGGRYYYALDITDPVNPPTFLWSFTDSKMGETWSEPAIGRVKIGNNEKFVAFVGGGYDTLQNNNSGTAFFVIDLETGHKLWEYVGDVNRTDDRQYMNFSFAANPTAVDLNNDGFIDRVYIGDVGGQVWKFDVSATGTGSWQGKRLFAAPLASGTTNPPAAGEYYPAQGIYGAPVLALDKDLKLWLFFGTGDRNHPNNTTSPNRFYGIKETTDMANGVVLTEANLADVTGVNATATQGWFFRLGANEKVLAAGNVFNMIAYFSTFTPTTTATCETGFGTAKLYAVQVKTGYAAVDFTTGDALTSTDATKTRSKTIGGGIASMPVIVLTPPSTADQKPLSSAVVGTTNQQVLGNLIPAPPAMKQVRWWRELAQ